MARTSGDLYGIRPTAYQLNAKYGASQASNQAAANANRLNQKYGASKENNAAASINTRAGATKDTNKLASLNNQYGASQASNQGPGLGLHSPDSSPDPAPRPSDSGTKSDYSGGIGVGNGKVYVGNILASNYATPWVTDAERMAANAAWVASDGLDPNKSYPMFDAYNNKIDYGYYGGDPTGGVYNKAGYSSNPYFLQTMAGITRDMTKGTSLENVPDAVIAELVSGTATPWEDDSWIEKSGLATSSVGDNVNYWNKGELRKDLANLTNQEYQYVLGIQNRSAPLVSPGGLGGSDMSALQAAILDTNRQHAAAMDGGYIPAIGVNAGLWQAGEMPMNRMVQDMVGNAPTQQQPTQPAPPQEDIVTQILKDLEVERRKKQQNIAEGT